MPNKKTHYYKLLAYILPTIIALVFISLKLTGIIDWHWGWVWLPVWVAALWSYSRIL